VEKKGSLSTELSGAVGALHGPFVQTKPAFERIKPINSDGQGAAPWVIPPESKGLHK
jgi:hypothetical protein